MDEHLPSFSDANFMTAKEKLKVAKQFKKFLEGGFKFEDFSKSLYKYLHVNYGFIAHYDRHGFYETEFGTLEDRIRFLNRLMDGYWADDYD